MNKIFLKSMDCKYNRLIFNDYDRLGCCDVLINPSCKI